MLIIFISVLVLALSFYLFRKAAGSLSPLKLNTISYVFYVQIVVLTFVGSVLVACGAVESHYLISYVGRDVKIYGWLGVLYSMLAMPLGMILLNKLFKINAYQKLRNYIQTPIQFSEGPVLSLAVLLVFIMIALFVIAYTFFHVEHVPLFTALQGNKVAAAIQRTEVRRNFGGIDFIPGFLGYFMIPVFAYYAWIHAVVKKKTIYWLAFSVLFLLAALFLGYDTQKAQIVLFFIGFLVLATFIKGGISRKQLVLAICISLLLVLAGYTITMSVKPIELFVDIKSALWRRIFIAEYGGYLLSLQLFPDVIKEPTWHIGIPGFIIDFLGWSNLESARLIMMHVNPEGTAQGTANLMSSYYLGEAWANYRWAGVILAPFIVGVVIQSVHIFLLTHDKEPLILSFYSYVTVRWMVTSGFVSFLYLKIIFFPFIMYLLFKVVIKAMANKKIKQLV